MFLSSKKLIGMVIEDPAYVTGGETLTSSNFIRRCGDVKYTPAIAETVRKYAVGDFASFPSVMGKQTIDIGFSMDVAWGGAVTTEPEWSLPLQACSWDKSTYAATGIGWALSSNYTAKPITIWVLETNADSTSQMAIKAAGCTGDAKLELSKVGDPLKINFSFKGSFAGVEDLSSLITSGTYQTPTPDAVLSSTITAFGEALDCDKVSIDSGNKLGMLTNPDCSSGVKGYVVTDHDPKLTVDPLLDTLASRAIYTRWVSGTDGTFSMEVGSHIGITANHIQILKAYDGGNRDNVTTNSLECRLNRQNDSTGAEIEILQGSKTA
jgi:hypothetical protein